MWCTNILVAFDDSEQALQSLEKAKGIAETCPDVKIRVVHVISIPASVSIEMDNFQAFDEAIYKEGENIVSKAKQLMSGFSERSEAVLLKGISPAYVILNHAREHGCDLIIMGSRGLTGIKEFLGSVSHTVVQNSQVPVLIVK